MLFVFAREGKGIGFCVFRQLIAKAFLRVFENELQKAFLRKSVFDFVFAKAFSFLCVNVKSVFARERMTAHTGALRLNLNTKNPALRLNLNSKRQTHGN
jgi:hypothetical protein